MRLNIVRPGGKVTFTYRVDADSASHGAAADCPWMEGHTATNQWMCMDGVSHPAHDPGSEELDGAP